MQNIGDWLWAAWEKGASYWRSAMSFSRSLVFSALIAFPFFASASVFTINASGRSGSDGNDGRSGSRGYYPGRDAGENGTYGQDGSDGGDVRLYVGYANPEKTLVQIRAEVQRPGSSAQIIEQTLPLNQLDRIDVLANGGSGGDGGSGGRGSEGERGRRGRDGCPPGNGGRGEDGGPGGNGGSGGRGGRGGRVQILTPDSQAELNLLIRAETRGGSGGAGGRAGQGGSYGLGGSGGSSTCRDSSGARTGSDGSSGYSGDSGPSGYNGTSGSSGQNGQAQFQLSGDPTGRSYNSPFQVRVTGLKVADQNGDGLIEPGENFEVQELSFSNLSLMPLPAGQVVQLNFENTEALSVVRKTPVQLTEPLNFGTSQSLRFAPGEFVMKANEALTLVGRSHALAFTVKINSLRTTFGSDLQIPIRRPLSVTRAAASTLRPYFDQAQVLNFDVKNEVLNQAPKRLARFWMQWQSDKVAGQDVSVVFPDGREENLSQRVEMDLPALNPSEVKSFSVKLKIRRGNVASAQGQLIYGLSAEALSGQNFVNLQASPEVVTVAEDFRALNIRQTLDTRYANVKCTFPQAGTGQWDLAYIEIQKDRNLEAVKVTFWTGGMLTRSQSPWYTVTIHELAPFVKNFTSSTTPAGGEVAQFMNDVMTKATSGGKEWAIGSCSAR